MAKKKTSFDRAVQALRDAAPKSLDLLNPLFREAIKLGCPSVTGFCYLFSEVLFHAFPHENFRSFHIRHEGVTHWYLVKPNGDVVDETVAQFKTKPDYTKGRHVPFLTKQPSRRARLLAVKAGIQLHV